MTIAIDREAVWVALFAHFESSLGEFFETMGREHIAPNDLSPAQQPALFQVQTGEARNPEPFGAAGKVTLSGSLFGYFLKDGTGAAGASTKLNALLTAIDDAFAGDQVGAGDERFTIGGLAYHCYIESTEMDPAFYDQQAAFAVHFKVLIP